MTAKRVIFTGLVVLFAMPLAPISAQDYGPPTLFLTSPDPAHPVQMQLLGEDGVPNNTDFAPMLTISPATDVSTIYVALRNTGWSEGVIGLTSSALDATEQYVALEVGSDGLPLAEGLVFPLAYDAELDGFRLRVVLAGARTFAIYQLVDAGTDCPCKVTTVANGLVTRAASHVTVAQEPVLSALFECHIVARPLLAAAETEVSGASAWGDCGSCSTCIRPEECVLSPDGQCRWDPTRCGSRFAAPPIGGGAEACVVTNEMAHCDRWDETCPLGVVSHCIQCYDNCGNPTLGGCSCSGSSG